MKWHEQQKQYDKGQPFLYVGPSFPEYGLRYGLQLKYHSYDNTAGWHTLTTPSGKWLGFENHEIVPLSFLEDNQRAATVLQTG